MSMLLVGAPVVDRALRTRRFLGYRESREWAADARPVVAELADLAARFPSLELVELLQRAAGHVVKVILRADDSDGTIGDLANELLDAHALACEAGVADPVKLARWMVRFSCRDQDFFLTDPVQYRTALGERGLTAFRKELAQAREQNTSQYGPPRFLHERLVVFDGDSSQIVATFGGDLSTPHQFISICEALAEHFDARQGRVLSTGSPIDARQHGRPRKDRFHRRSICRTIRATLGAWRDRFTFDSTTPASPTLRCSRPKA